MTDINPIPACLSHLTQRDAAVRARALEEAAQIADRFTCGGCGMDGKTGIAIRAMMQVPKEVTVVRRESPTPPAPDEAAIRAELVAAARNYIDGWDDCENTSDDKLNTLFIVLRAALAKATS